MTAGAPLRAEREDDDAGRVTNVELFFDLVYVFAVTQLSEVLVRHTTVEGVLQAGILLLMVWQAWVYTTWAINYLDPDQPRIRVLLLVLMLGSLVLAAALPEAFGRHGLLMAVTYVGLQVGRTLFALWALRGTDLQLVFQRILGWLLLSGAAVVAGGLAHGHAREVLWIGSIAIDLAGARLGFFVPGLGRPDTSEWSIDGGHFAERCQAFVLIALGESIVEIGVKLQVDGPSTRDVLAFAAAFLGVVGLWWVYFDRAAEDSARELEESDDPGRIARSAFHWVHPLIVGGIILTAAADERVLDEPAARGEPATAWLVLGGTALFLAGHAVFKALLWRVVSWVRVAGAGALVLLALVASGAPVLVLGACALAAVVAVGVVDRLIDPGLRGGG